MSSGKDDSAEPDTKERFFQTYLLVSSLLLTIASKDYEKMKLNGFAVFLTFILLYYTIPTIMKTSSYKRIVFFFSYIFAIVASLGLAVLIFYTISPTNNHVFILIIALGCFIACTLIPDNWHPLVITIAFIVVTIGILQPLAFIQLLVFIIGEPWQMAFIQLFAIMFAAFTIAVLAL
jgi:hypothetical protein